MGLELDVEVLDRGGAAGLLDLERVQAPDDHADLGAVVHGADLRVLQDRALGDELAVLDADVGDLHADAGVQARGQAGADLEAEQAAAEQRVLVAAGLDRRRHRVHDRLRQALGALDAVDLRRAVLTELAGQVVGDALADDDRVALGAELGRELRALGDRAERVLVDRAVVVQRVDQDPAHASSFLSSSHATIFSTVSLVSSSSMIWPADLAGGAAKSLQCARAWSKPTRSASMPDVARRLDLQRLLLGAHDRLQRRVARLVDRVADRDHGRELDVHRVVAVLGLTLAAQRAVLDVDLDHLGQ